jgi:hypothetical protein
MMNLAGKTPNGHDFISNPRRLWLIDSSRAVMNGQDPGPAGALAQRARVNDFLIPHPRIRRVKRRACSPLPGVWKVNTNTQRSYRESK